MRLGENGLLVFEVSAWTGALWERVQLVHASDDVEAFARAFSALVSDRENRPVRLTRLQASVAPAAVPADRQAHA